MSCVKCSSILYYSTCGLLCRNCGYTYDKDKKFFCIICSTQLEEWEKQSCMCVFCTYELLTGGK